MTTALTDLTECIRPQLEAVDRLFHKELSSDLRCVNTLVKHVSRFRGKMLRPCLVLLSGRACAAGGRLSEAHTVIATVVEMVHMATLVHDDVLDEAELRRKGATINHLRGNEAAVLLGDYLISHSYHLCSGLESQFASRLIGRTTNSVCEGELLQIDNRNNLDLDEQTYLQIIERKTASLCAACCLPRRQVRRRGRRAGRRAARPTACRSAPRSRSRTTSSTWSATRGAVGKTLGIDVEKGKMTLPLIHFLRTAPPEHQALLRSLLSGPDPDRAERIRNLILPSRSLQYARDRARQLVDTARGACWPCRKPKPATHWT